MMPRDGKLSILHIMAGSDAGGLTRYVYDLGMAMHARGHQIAVAGQRGAAFSLFHTAPFPWIDIPLKGGPMALYRSVHTLRRFMKSHRVDLLHTHYRRGTLLARWLRRGSDLPLLYTLHLSHVPLRWPRILFADFGDHTHAPSAEAGDWLRRTACVPASQLTVIPHGIDAARFPVASEADRRAARAELGLPPHADVAAYVGRFDRVKNVPWMLDVAEAARGRLPDLRIVLAGGGPDTTWLRKQILRRGLYDRVVLLNHRDPLAVYQAADLLLLPSLREGFSLASAEAMCVGVPVLRTRTSGTAELIVEGVTGRSTPIKNEAFVSTAVEMLLDRARLRTMGRAAAGHVREHFPFDRQLDQTVELYRRLIERRAFAE